MLSTQIGTRFFVRTNDMQIENFGEAVSFHDAPLGSIIMLQGANAMEFGIVVGTEPPDPKRGCVVLNPSNDKGKPILISANNLGDDTAWLVPGALLRPILDAKCISIGEQVDQVGKIVCANGHNYITAITGTARRAFFDLESGLMFPRSLIGPQVWFSKWQLGIRDGNSFKELLSFSVSA
jgi:hypothetical protein